MLVLSSMSILAYDFEVDGIYYNIISESNLTVEVTYPSREIGMGGYHYKCYYSGDISIPNNVTYNNAIYTVIRIGSYAFATDNTSSYEVYFTRLKSIKLPSTLTSIGELAFWTCRALTVVSIPETVTIIENNAFAGCNSVGTFFVQSSIPPQSNYGYNISAFGKHGEIVVPQKEPYLADENWSQYGERIVELITIDKKEITYSGNEHEIKWENNMKSYQMEVSGNKTVVNAGNNQAHINVVCYKGEDIYANCTFDYNYTIKKTPLEFKIGNATREYGEENPSLEYFSINGFIKNEDTSSIDELPEVVTTAIKTSNVGDYPITISGGSATNYEFVYEPGVLTVTKAPLSAKIKDATKVYGTQNPTFIIEYNGLKNGETTPDWTTKPTFQTEATQRSNVGLYEVKAENGNPVNYDLDNITPGTLSITPAPLKIKANDASRQYYEENPQLTYSYSGFVNGDNESKLSAKPELSTNAKLTSGVGTYEINVSNAESKNYSISNVSGMLTITPRTLLASVGNYERYYNEENPTFEVKYDGFAGNEDESVLNSKAVASSQATKTSDVGTYPINITGGSADNYRLSYNSGVLTINKAEQIIIWVQNLSNLKTGNQIELKAEASSGLPITYIMNSNGAAEIYSAGSKQYLDCLSSGQFIIRAVQEGNKNYYSSPRVSNTVSIIGNATPSDPTLTIQQADNGSICTQVQKGSVYTFSITPSKSWKIHSVTFNDVDVTNQLYDGSTFTTPAITTNSILAVVYELDDIDEIRAINESNVTIQGTSYGASVIGANIGDVISIYTTDGSLYHSVKAKRQVVDIPLKKDNVYIIKVGTQTMKLSH